MSRRRGLLLGFALVLLTLVVYWPATSAGFIWDDDDYLTENPTLLDGEGLRRIWFEPGAVPQYYPLYHTSFWIQRQLWGLEPFGFHLVNILLHGISAVLVWRLLGRLGLPGAWLAAAIFAIHPLQVESVAWVTEHKNILSGAFYFAAALAWVRAERLDRDLSDADAGQHDRRLYLVALGLFALALLSKTATATLPAALVILLWWKRGGVSRPQALRLVPFFVLSAAMGLMTIWMESSVVGAEGAEWDLSFAQKSEIAGRALWFYLGRLAWPSQPCFVYPRWEIGGASLAGLSYPLAALAVLAALWVGRTRLGRGPLTAALYFCITLFPALGFFNVYWMRYSFVADHFQYLAGLGPIAALVATGANLLGRRTAAAPFARYALGGVLLATLGAGAFAQARVYRDIETLWLDTLQKNPKAWLAHHNLALYYERAGKRELAAEHYQAARDHGPAEEITLYNLAGVLAREGSHEEAVATYEHALRLHPDRAESHNNLGALLFQMGRKAEASAHLRRAVELSPRYAEARRNLAVALVDQDSLAAAADHLWVALLVQPDDVGSMLRLVSLLPLIPDPEGMNQKSRLVLAEKAVEVTRGEEAACLATLASVYGDMGRTRESIRILQHARTVALAQGQTDLASRYSQMLDAMPKSDR